MRVIWLRFGKNERPRAMHTMGLFLRISEFEVLRRALGPPLAIARSGFVSAFSHSSGVAFEVLRALLGTPLDDVSRWLCFCASAPWLEASVGHQFGFVSTMIRKSPLFSSTRWVRLCIFTCAKCAVPNNDRGAPPRAPPHI